MKTNLLVLGLLAGCLAGDETDTKVDTDTGPTLEFVSAWYCSNKDATWEVSTYSPVAMTLKNDRTGDEYEITPGCSKVNVHSCAAEGLPWPLEASLHLGSNCWYAYSAGVPDTNCNVLPHDYGALTALCPL